MIYLCCHIQTNNATNVAIKIRKTSMETKKQSVFMQMHNGSRRCEGSFNAKLQELFYLAGTGNKRKLVKAFPEFFGDKVPEFGITL
jgi:hypothetical protein